MKTEQPDLELLLVFVSLARRMDRRSALAAITWMLNRAKDPNTQFLKRDPELLQALDMFSESTKARRQYEQQLSALISTRKVLRAVYETYGPGSVGSAKKYPPVEYARLTTQEIDAKWDFTERHLMHRVAKALAKIGGAAL